MGKMAVGKQSEMAKDRTVNLVIDKMRKSLKNKGDIVRDGIRKELIIVLEKQTRRHI